MFRAQSSVAVLCVLLTAYPALAADAAALNSRERAHQVERPDGFLAGLTRNYRPTYVPPIDLSNSNRLDALLRAGNLYLSLQDAIALALENNLDIEIQRYGPQIADASVMRARAGGFARGVSTSVQSGPASSTGGAGAGGGGGATQTGISGNAASAATTGGGAGSHQWSRRPAARSRASTPSSPAALRWAHTTHAAVERLRHRHQLLHLAQRHHAASAFRRAFSPAPTSTSASATRPSPPTTATRISTRPPTVTLGLTDHAAAAAGLRRGGQLAPDPDRQEQPRDLRPHLQEPGDHHGFGGDEPLLGPGELQRGRAGEAAVADAGGEAVQRQQEAGGDRHAGADRDRARRGRDGRAAAGPDDFADAGAAAGDDSEERAEPQRRGEPDGGGGAHRAHGPHPGAGRGGGRADPGPGGERRFRRGRNSRRAACR